MVDDEPMIREITSAMLEDLGCSVQTASSGSSALAKITYDKSISLLMTDVQMPEMDGLELARRAVQIRPGLAVVIMSARDYRDAGFTFVHKPFSQRELQQVVCAGCAEVRH
jgi:two-component system, cell cycle response regulator CpdR